MVSPAPPPEAPPGILQLSTPAARTHGIRVGDGPVRIEGVAFDQDNAQQLRLDSWELSATALGGKVRP